MVSCGVLLGALVKDINTLFATIKSTGVFLYAPAFMFSRKFWPGLAKFFPRIISWLPLSRSARTAAHGQTWLWTFLLVGLILALLGVIAFVVRRAGQVGTSFES